MRDLFQLLFIEPIGEMFLDPIADILAEMAPLLDAALFFLRAATLSGEMGLGSRSTDANSSWCSLLFGAMPRSTMGRATGTARHSSFFAIYFGLILGLFF